jgi:hypothetical protein
MSDVSEQLKQWIDANPKIVEVAGPIARDHDEEIKRILAEDANDSAKRIGRLHALVRRESPRDDPTPVSTPTPTQTPTDPDDPVAAQAAAEADAIEAQVVVILVLAALVIITL